MRVHFLHRHSRDTVVMLDEVNLPHPRCPRCGMLVPCKSLNGKHVTTSQCAKGTERKIRRMTEEEMQESVDRAFQAYVRPLATVTLFKYLGLVLTVADDNLPVEVGNLRKA